MAKSEKTGRPTVITPKVVSKLIVAFEGGSTVRDACWHAGISHEAYYSRVRDDEVFADKMDKAQQEVGKNAREVVVNAIKKGDLSTAKWWLERKNNQEFSREPSTLEKEPSEPISQAELDRGVDMLIELRQMREYNDASQ